MQRFRRDIFIRPVGSHKALFHGVLATCERDVRIPLLLEAFGNRDCRENVATGATAYKQELFHSSVLINSKPLNAWAAELSHPLM